MQPLIFRFPAKCHDAIKRALSRGGFHVIEDDGDLSLIGGLTGMQDRLGVWRDQKDVFHYNVTQIRHGALRKKVEKILSCSGGESNMRVSFEPDEISEEEADMLEFERDQTLIFDAAESCECIALFQTLGAEPFQYEGDSSFPSVHLKLSAGTVNISSGPAFEIGTLKSNTYLYLTPPFFAFQKSSLAVEQARQALLLADSRVRAY